MSEDDRDDDGSVVTLREPRVAKPRRWCVVFWNDDSTPKWFVVIVLERFFRMTETIATSFMMSVHRTGRGIAGVYVKDIAETKAKQVMDFAREHGMPLKVTAEPDEHGDDDA